MVNEENKFEVPESFKEKYSENPEKAIEELYKAQHKIVEQKKSAPAENKHYSIEEMAEMNRKFYEENKFFDSNPDMLEHKEKINEFTSKGLSYEQARKLVTSEDPTIESRQTAKKSNFTAGDPAITPSEFSVEDLSKMSQTDYNNAMASIDSGKAKLIN